MSSTTSSKRATAAASDGSAAGAPDRRTRHRHRRRDAVYAAAIELFVEQGFDNTTMEQIAERADVARATVFNHFQRKTAFLDEWTARRRQRAASAVLENVQSGESLETIITRYMIEMATLSEENRAETVALMDACLHNINLLAHPALGTELASFIQSAQREGEAPSDLDAKQAGVLAATAYFAVLSQWILEEPAPFDLRKELLAMVDTVLHGMISADDEQPVLGVAGAEQPQRPVSP